MVRTFNDFLAECEAYEHSREHYELMKECAEIQLMEQYVSDQIYVAEYADILGQYNFNENYFTENEGKTEAVNEKLGEKKQGVITKIIKWIVDKFKAIGRFLVKWWEKITGQDQEVERLQGVVTNLTSEQKKEVAVAVNDAMNEVLKKHDVKAGNFFNFINGSTRLKLGGPTKEEGQAKALEFFLNKTWTIDTVEAGCPNAIHPDDIYRFSVLETTNGDDRRKWIDWEDFLNKSIKRTQKDKLRITFDRKTKDAMLGKENDIITKLSQFNASEKNYDANTLMVMRRGYETFLKAVADTIRVFTIIGELRVQAFRIIGDMTKKMYKES